MANADVFFKNQPRTLVQRKNAAGDFAVMLANPFFPEVISNRIYYFHRDGYWIPASNSVRFDASRSMML
ncbi:hypothetical protein AK821_08415 [Pseudomonas sp. RIT-PI-r]|nr:hypothetical protein AK821_08415 [Pseudomonas sp. RIT-PI-r]